MEKDAEFDQFKDPYGNLKLQLGRQEWTRPTTCIIFLSDIEDMHGNPNQQSLSLICPAEKPSYINQNNQTFPFAVPKVRELCHF